METIRLATWIDAPVKRCFLLSLSIDLHVASSGRTKERAIDGVTAGIIGEGEMVTFQGRHFGVRLRHTSRIEILRPYSYFRDVMVAGVFRHFEHDHHFAPLDDGTRVRDEIRFSLRGGPLGRLVAKMFVRRHLTAFLNQRNAAIKQVAESEAWRQYVDDEFLRESGESIDRLAETPVAGKKPVRWDSKTQPAAAHKVSRPPGAA
jgi:ligand-binding SRPBCC domain-containing protein